MIPEDVKKKKYLLFEPYIKMKQKAEMIKQLKQVCLTEIQKIMKMIWVLTGDNINEEQKMIEFLDSTLY